MPSIFSNGNKVAIVAADDSSVPMGLVVGDFKNSMSAKGILTNFSMDGQGGVQVTHSLRNAIYLNTFGERMGNISIGGMLFSADCKDSNVAIQTGTATSGISKFIDWYESNRITTIGAPIAITISPGLVVSGFLISMKFQIEDPALPIAQFIASFLYPPRITKPKPSINLGAVAVPSVDLGAVSASIGALVPRRITLISF